MTRFSTLSIHKTLLLAITIISSLAASAAATGGHHRPPPALSPGFYKRSCPSVFRIVKDGVRSAVRSDVTMAAALLRLHFHDCFVNGCDASVLLDDTATSTGEKNARPNQNSLDGFDVVDAIKSRLEDACPGIVSCADILAIVARDAVVQVHGPSWDVKLGRRDSLSASTSAANAMLPGAFESLAAIIAKFAAVGLTEHDVASLSGAHTIGRARCSFVAPRLYNFNGTGLPDPTLSTSYADLLRAFCGPPTTESTSATVVNLDVSTPDVFDNKYFQNLKFSNGLLASDQVLLSTPGAATIRLVNVFASNQKAFFAAFARSMVKMGDISPLLAPKGQIRRNCRLVNA